MSTESTSEGDRERQPGNGFRNEPPVAGELAIEVVGLRKSYGEQQALAGIDLRVRRGEIFAVLGPNGAGKTTAVEILEGYRHRDSGTVSVLGQDPATGGPDWRSRIGVVLQESAPERDLTVAECAELYAGYYPRSRPVGEVLELVGLTGQSGTLAQSLSGGQQRRLDVALALVGRPELVFLDEPTTGFDPAARRACWEMIDGLRGMGTTIVLTTHYMEEAERLADRIAVVAGGRIVAEGTPESIGRRLNAAAQITFTIPPEITIDDLPSLFRTDAAAGRVQLSSASPLELLGVLAGWAADKGVELPDLEVRRPSLEEIYLQITTTQGPSLP
jgi:ABC-2 type transport system ATP-binding protein